MRLPVPVLAWSLLLIGHGLSLLVPVPADAEVPARAAAILCAVLSLTLGAVGSRRPPRALGGGLAEPMLGIAAIVLGGVALGGEADRAAWPLPVHPRATRVELDAVILDTTAIDADLPTLLIDVESVEVAGLTADCHARLTLQWEGDGVAPLWAVPGLRLHVRGLYHPPEDARNPGATAPGGWLVRSGVEGTVEVDPTSVALRGDRPAPGPGGAALLRHRIARLLGAYLSRPTGALARGMILGDRSGIGTSLRDSFRDSGTIHILSISGLHVCLLAGIVALLAIALRLPSAAAIALELAALWGYVALVGGPPPAVRSAILWTALRAGRVVGTSVRPFAAWGLAGLVLHLWDPAAPSDAGFALSFAAVLGLAVAGGLVSGGAEPHAPGLLGRARALGSSALGLAVQSLGAEGATLGIQAKLFGAVPIAGLLVNLAIVPLCALFMAEVLLFLGCAALVRPAAPWAASAVELTGLTQIALTRAAAGWVPPWPVHAEPALVTVVLGLLALLLAAGWREAHRRGRPRTGATRVIAAASLALAWTLPLVPWGAVLHAFPLGLRLAAPERPVILFIDVGQGDASLAMLAGSKSLLVDAGPSDDRRDAGRGAVEPVLRAEGVDRLALALLSHAHRDHYGGLRWLARRGWIGRLLENGRDRAGSWRRELGRDLGAKGGTFVPVERDTALRLGSSASLSIRADPRALPPARTGNADENNHSLVARLEVNGRSVLWSGDVEEAGERALLPGLRPVDLLKVPHHGSRTSSTAAWIDALRPSVAVISCGERNRFGHPDRATIGRYLLRGTRVLRTDQEGAIRITLAREGMWISTRRCPDPELVPWRAGQSP